MFAATLLYMGKWPLTYHASFWNNCWRVPFALAELIGRMVIVIHVNEFSPVPMLAVTAGWFH